jgi:hypothetical protein
LRTIEPHSLLTGANKEITINHEIERAFNIWKDKRKNDKLKPLEIFYAGYILANPIVREQYVKSVE